MRPRFSRRHLSTGLLFAAATAISAVSPLVYIPVVTSFLGAAGFQDLAVGQSIGAAGAVLAGLGWNFTGPVAVARSDAAGQALVLRRALALQAMITALVLPPGALLAVHLVEAYPAGAALAAVATTVLGAAPSWFLVGLGRGDLLVIYDAVPKLIGAVGGAAAILLTRELWPLPAVQLAVVVGALGLLVRRTHVPNSRLREGLGLWDLARTLRAQFSLSVAQLASAVYINLPVTLLAAVGAPGLAVFAAADRYLRLAMAATSPVTQVFQGWVPRASQGVLGRVRTTLWAHVGVALLGAGLFLVGAPLVQALLFSGEVPLPWEVNLVFAAIFLVVVINRAVGVVALPTLGGRASIAASSLAGAVIGAPAILVLGQRAGALGGGIGVLLAEVVVLVVQASVLASGWRAQRAPTAHRAP